MTSTSDEDNTTRRTTDDFTTGLGQSGGSDGADGSQRPVIESWVASTQNWMNARFADWDTRNPQTADYVIVNDYYDVERLAPRPATSSRLATAPEPSDRPGPPMASSAGSSSKPALQQDSRSAIVRPVSLVRQWKSFGPIWVNEQPGLGIANELNLKNEGIGVVPPRNGPEIGRADPVRRPCQWPQRSIERSSSSWLGGQGR